MFDFIEIDNNLKLNLNNNSSCIKIPENQYISLLDLKIINPDKKLLNMNKYSIIPLFILENNQKPNVPNHLKSEYWGFIQNKNNKKYMYIALENNLDNIVLNIIQNITKYSIIAIPIKKETVIEFYKSDSYEIENKSNYDDIKYFIKENLFYIFFFVFIVLLLISFRFYIH